MNWFVSPFNSLSLYQLYPLIPRICPLSIQPSIKNSLACHVWCTWGVHAGVFYCFLFRDSLSWFFESLSLKVHNPSVDRWILSSFLIVVFFCVSSVFTHHVHFFSFRFVSFLFGSWTTNREMSNDVDNPLTCDDNDYIIANYHYVTSRAELESNKGLKVTCEFIAILSSQIAFWTCVTCGTFWC